MGYNPSVKSCGVAHPWCNVCRPEIAAKIRIASQRPRGPRSAKTRAKIGASNRLAAHHRPPISDETRQKMSLSQRNRTSHHSKSSRLKISKARRKHIAACRDSECRSAACNPSPPRGPTRIENILVDVLLAEFPEVRREERFGRYRIDAYLPPPYHLAFEADGAYWHQDAQADAARDAQLLIEHSLLVIRIGEQELLALGKMD